MTSSRDRVREEARLRVLEDVAGSAGEVACRQRRPGRRPASRTRPRRRPQEADQEPAKSRFAAAVRHRRARRARRHRARGRSPRGPVHHVRIRSRRADATATDRSDDAPGSGNEVRFAASQAPRHVTREPDPRLATSAARDRREHLVGRARRRSAAPSRSERQDEVGERPGGVDVMLDEHDRGRPLRAGARSRSKKAAAPGGSRLAVGSSRTRTSGRGGEHPGEREPLLLAARQAVRPTALEDRARPASAIASGTRAASHRAASRDSRARTRRHPRPAP